MKIKEQILRQEIINWLDGSILQKTLIDQFAMNDFSPLSDWCFCEIRENWLKHIDECYDKHMGKELKERTHLLLKIGNAYYESLKNLVLEEVIDVYEDEVMYLGDDAEHHSLLSEYLPTRNLIVSELEDSFTDICYELMFQELRQEKKEEIKEISK
jgi:hypothetical protein